MKLIKPSVEIIDQEPGKLGLFRHIEKCGRTCYKSEDKITDDSAEKFVNMLVNRGHTAMIEHGTVYLKYPFEGDYPPTDAYNFMCEYDDNFYSRVSIPVVNDDGGFIAVTTNYRVLLQNDWLDDLEFLCEPTEHHAKRVTVRFVIDRGVSHEFVRHRVFSFAQESTRYCNYSKDKFGKECTFVIPTWCSNLTEGRLDYYRNGKEMTESLGYYEPGTLIQHTLKDFCDKGEVLWAYSCKVAENQYSNLLLMGWVPQQARAVLPNSLKTELIMTGTVGQWLEFFKLRCARDAHPQAKEVADLLRDKMLFAGHIKIDDNGEFKPA